MSGGEIANEEQAESGHQAKADPLPEGVQRDAREGFQVKKITNWKYEQENNIII